MNSKKIKVIHKTGNEVQADCRLWAREIADSYRPDLVIFIAKSGYLFAKPMCEVFRCEMVDLLVERPGSGAKDKLKSIMSFLPQEAIDKILSSRMMYTFNEKKEDRSITETDSFRAIKNKEFSNILIIDDSVDTGWTIEKTIPVVQNNFKKANIKIASYSVIRYSKKRVTIDFSRIEDTIVITSTSRKSDEYDDFIKSYEKWENGHR